jgi:formate dehydrogenase assembly factor FdhD
LRHARFDPALPRADQRPGAPDLRGRAVNEYGETEKRISIPAERALTVYVDKRELVTLMTLGAHPEWLVLGYLRNQRLVQGRGRHRLGDGRLGRGRRRRQDARTASTDIEERTAAAWSPPAAARAACSAA